MEFLLPFPPDSAADDDLRNIVEKVSHISRTVALQKRLGTDKFYHTVFVWLAFYGLLRTKHAGFSCVCHTVTAVREAYLSARHWMQCSVRPSPGGLAVF